MNFTFNLPVKLIFGDGCVKNHPESFLIGKKAFIVTGRHGAKESGALDDVVSVLEENGIEYVVYSEVRENPRLLPCFDAGEIAKENNCDLVIGIGGGSALDASKAIAAFAAQSYVKAFDIFDASKKTAVSLPLILIPTTAGTGSEANNYSVLTLEDGLKKKTFTHADSWARTAFIDPRYTYTLSRDYTFSTALDAFHHTMESYLSPRHTPISEALSVMAGKAIWDVLSQYPSTFTPEMREALIFASCIAGAAISITGTGFPHPLGYSLTLIDGIPHGRACAAFAEDYIEYNCRSELGAERIDKFCEEIGAKRRSLGALLSGLSNTDIVMSDEEIKHHIDLIKDAKNYANSPYVISESEMADIYRKHFMKK